MLAALVALVLTSLASAAEPPQAAGLPVVVHWSAPQGCATQAELLADIESLADAPLVPASDPHRVEARINATAGGYALTLEQAAPDGTPLERSSLEASDCRLLSRAAALIVAVTVAPLQVSTTLERLKHDAATERAQPPVPLQVEAEPLPTIPPPLPTSPAPRETAPVTRTPLVRSERQPAWKHRFVAGGLVGVAVGAVPRAALQLSGWGGYALGPLRLELSGEHAFARTRALEPGVEIEASSSGGGATVVFTPTLGSVLGLAGVGLRAGVLQGGGQGERVVRQATSDWWLSVPLLVGVAWPASARIALRAQVEFSVTARRPAISIGSPAGDVGGFRRAPIGLSALLGPEFRLP